MWLHITCSINNIIFLNKLLVKVLNVVVANVSVRGVRVLVKQVFGEYFSVSVRRAE